MRKIAIVAVLILLMAGCGAGRTSGICGTLAPTLKGDAVAWAKQGSDAWAGRIDEKKLREAISHWMKSLAANPEQPKLRVRLARALYFLADGYLRFQEEKSAEMMKTFESATNQAEIALGQLYPKYRSKYCGRRSYADQIATLDQKAGSAMYWYAASLGKYALEKSIILVLNEKDRIKAMMDALYSWDRKFYYYAADRYLGAFYTKIPFPKGDLARSRAHFEASIKGAPQYLSTKVLFAKMNLVKAYSRAKTPAAKKAIRDLYKGLLDSVVSFDLKSAPKLIPENTIEQKKAKQMLDELDVDMPVD